jgi:hypothetical protein
MPVKDKDAVTTLDPRKEMGSTAGAVADESVSHTRRKVIRASAAAIPAIMTLRSGAAAAMASTYQCTARDNRVALNEIGSEDYVLEANSDHWLRIMGKKVIRNVRGTDTVIYCTETGPGGPSPADAWQCFNEDGTAYTGNLSAAQIERGEDAAFLAFLNFDGNGNDTGEPVLYYPIIQTVTPAPPGYSPITGSCLASIHPNLNLLG